MMQGSFSFAKSKSSFHTLLLIKCMNRTIDVGRILCQFEEEMKNDDVSFHTTSTKHYKDNEHFCLNFTERMYRLFSMPFPATHSNLIVFAPSAT